MKHGDRLLLLLIILCILITVGRYSLFYQGAYDVPTIPEIDTEEIVPHLPEYRPFEDQPTLSHSYVIIDVMHANNLKIDDLSPLRDRMEARGAVVETLSLGPSRDDDNDVTLRSCLHRATSLIVAAPTQAYTPEEQEVIAEFVRDGGHLLLAADPTRPVPEDEEEEDIFTPLYSVFFPTSAVPVINSLANVFGVVYFDDYLYNLNDNAGNYRNVKFKDLSDDHPLTQGLETVVFFAAHSLRSEGLSLIRGDAHTHSPVRSGETGLTAASLTNEGRVLALGDITFMTPPYHTIEDNDRFLSYIADWLTDDERIRDRLDDFPYIFTRPVDLIPIGGETVDPRIIVYGSTLQDTFKQAGLMLDLQVAPQPNHDALFIGTFEDAAHVHEYLTTAGITVTVPFTDGASVTDVHALPGDKEKVTENEAATVSQGETTNSENGSEGGDKLSVGNLEIDDLGKISLKGTQLFVLQTPDVYPSASTRDQNSEPTAVIVLAEDEPQLIAALERLTANDFSNCVEYEGESTSPTDTEHPSRGLHPLMICSTGDAQEERETEPESSRAEEDMDQRIFILAYDIGTDGERTGAPELQAILGDSYDVTVWSVSEDGMPESEDMEGYAAYIVDTGDYTLSPDDTDFMTALDNIEVFRVMFIGAQSMPLFDADYAPVYDLEVADGDHLLAEGFEAGDVIPLLDSESGVPALVVSEVEEDDLADTSSVVFNRGPESPEAGKPALMAIVEDGEESRAVIATFAFYRLPEEVQRLLALNVVEWLLDEE